MMPFSGLCCWNWLTRSGGNPGGDGEEAADDALEDDIFPVSRRIVLKVDEEDYANRGK